VVLVPDAIGISASLDTAHLGLSTLNLREFLTFFLFLSCLPSSTRSQVVIMQLLINSFIMPALWVSAFFGGRLIGQPKRVSSR